MSPDDFGTFAKAWLGAAEMQTGTQLSDPAVKLAYRVLIDFELDEIKNGLLLHCRATHWIATPAHVIAKITGELPANAALYSLALDRDTPLGCFIRWKTGGDITKLTQSNGVQRIAMILPKIEQFWQRAMLGNFTDAELRLIKSAELDPAGELAPGVSGPRLKYRQAVAQRAGELKPQARLESHEPWVPTVEVKARSQALINEAFAAAGVTRREVAA